MPTTSRNNAQILNALIHKTTWVRLHQLYPIALLVRDAAFLALFFLLFGKPAFISAYAFGLIVELDLDRDLPDFFWAFMCSYKLITSAIIR